MSFRFIEDHRDTYPVRLMCAVHEVSPAGYYAWHERPVSASVTSNAALVLRSLADFALHGLPEPKPGACRLNDRALLDHRICSGFCS
ncbi:hypothetical protein ACVMIH_007675 [Bradyrhizobium sp. USDA 4503]